MMNIFSEDDFINAFGLAYFPDQKVTSELFELEGKLWKLPCIAPLRPINGSAFIDFLEPLDDKLIAERTGFAKVPYLQRVSMDMVSCSEWVERNLDQSFQAAPTILWSAFASWDAFISHVKQKSPKLFSDSRRRQRKLEKDLGSLQFIFDDCRPEVLATCFRWKSEQLRYQGLPDRFTNPEHIRLFEELANRQLLLVSSLSTKSHLLAIHVGMLNKGRLYSWNTAYASTYSQYAPGRLLLHFLLEESFKLRHKEFDFLWGDEDYKWNYATHVRLIKDIGQRPLSKQLESHLKDVLRPFPKVKEKLKQFRNKVLSVYVKNPAN